jgi:hypothetical protein
MPLGALRLKKAGLVLALLVWSSVSLISCGGSGPTINKPPSGLTERVMASQSVSATFTLGGLFIVDVQNDTLAQASEVSAGTSPGFMAISPTRSTLLAFDSASNSVEVINTTTETNAGRIQLPGPTNSLAVPTSETAYAAVPTASGNLFTSPGGIEVMDLTSGAITTTIGSPGAQTVVPNSTGTQLLVFSNDSNSVNVISPAIAVPLVDQGCDTAPNPVCTVIAGFDRPVGAIVSGATAYILNCGAECGGTQASVQILNLSTMTAGASVPVDGATVGFVSGSTLYVAGTSPANHACTGETTAATSCGRLDVVDLGSMKVTNRVVITDGYHDHLDMSSNGQLFAGSRNCTEIGNVNNPSGEVRGCLAIYNTANGSVIIPPDNGDVTGLQSFTSLLKEYVAEGGNLRVYDTTIDKLLINTILTAGTINITGQIADVKAVDFF